jgi:hypothetical protein
VYAGVVVSGFVVWWRARRESEPQQVTAAAGVEG